MKNSLCGPPVASGIVQDALLHAVGLQIFASKRVAAKRQGQRTREARPVKQEGIAGKLRGALRANVLQIIVEECLNPPIDRTKRIPEHEILLVVIPEQGAGHLKKIGTGVPACGMT